MKFSIRKLPKSQNNHVAKANVCLKSRLGNKSYARWESGPHSWGYTWKVRRTEERKEKKLMRFFFSLNDRLKKKQYNNGFSSREEKPVDSFLLEWEMGSLSKRSMQSLSELIFIAHSYTWLPYIHAVRETWKLPSWVLPFYSQILFISLPRTYIHVQ
jgi:hypothetical protein